jgi:hypothetical protein
LLWLKYFTFSKLFQNFVTLTNPNACTGIPPGEKEALISQGFSLQFILHYSSTFIAFLSITAASARVTNRSG